MSVYTQVDKATLEKFLAHYSVGELVGYEGILAGIENSNYFVATTLGEYVLTLFESHPSEDVGFFLDVTSYLAQQGIPCAQPIRDKAGRCMRILLDRPAALVKRMPGSSVIFPSIAQCQAIGSVLGRMHRVGRHYPEQRTNDRGPVWWQRIARELVGGVSLAEGKLLEEELAYLVTGWPDDLPCGLIHADLFRDNVLFEGDQLSALLDFNNACTDMLLFDVAVTVNDWCTETGGRLDQERTAALMTAYQDQRPLTDAERQAWPRLLRAAAFRFWVSRLQHRRELREGELIHSKDPEEFRRILKWRREEAGQASEILDL